MDSLIFLLIAFLIFRIVFKVIFTVLKSVGGPLAEVIKATSNGQKNVNVADILKNLSQGNIKQMGGKTTYFANGEIYNNLQDLPAAQQKKVKEKMSAFQENLDSSYQKNDIIEQAEAEVTHSSDFFESEAQIQAARVSPESSYQTSQAFDEGQHANDQFRKFFAVLAMIVFVGGVVFLIFKDSILSFFQYL